MVLPPPSLYHPQFTDQTEQNQSDEIKHVLAVTGRIIVRLRDSAQIVTILCKNCNNLARYW